MWRAGTRWFRKQYGEGGRVDDPAIAGTARVDHVVEWLESESRGDHRINSRDARGMISSTPAGSSVSLPRPPRDGKRRQPVAWTFTRADVSSSTVSVRTQRSTRRPGWCAGPCPACWSPVLSRRKIPGHGGCRMLLPALPSPLPFFLVTPIAGEAHPARVLEW